MVFSMVEVWSLSGLRPSEVFFCWCVGLTRQAKPRSYEAQQTNVAPEQGAYLD